MRGGGRARYGATSTPSRRYTSGVKHPLPLIFAFSFTLSGCWTEDAPTGDEDGDGVPDATDCAPTNRFVFPGAEDEIGDDLDSDCDGLDGVDADGDGYPGNAAGHLGYEDVADCDDSDALVHPGVLDLGGDSIDSDCDGGDGVDADGDGHGSVESGGLDCDDDQPNIHPGAPDPVGGGDSNCDGSDGVDDDHDGYATIGSGGTDCDDTNAAVHPGAFDACDGADVNCLPNPQEVDGDGDGSRPCSGDCDDTNAGRFPGAVEICDSIDQDCDGSTGASDGDGDGVRNCDGDCDDGDATRHPGAAETCDGLDADCDGALGVGEADGDGDGFAGCAGDCADNDALRWPGNWLDGPQDGMDLDCSGDTLFAGLPAASRSLGPDLAANRFGAVVVSGFDLDGDGLDDLAVGSPGSAVTGGGSAPQGRVLLWYGSSLSDPFVGLSLAPATADRVLTGESAFDQAGAALASAGDVDADGYDDLVIGAYGNDTAAQNAGAVYVVRGGPTLAGGSLATAAWRFRGEGLDHQAGFAVAGGGDVDGDGQDDILIGASGRTGAGPWTGAAYLFTASAFPSAGNVISLASAPYRWDGPDEGTYAGSGVALGDVDGDTRADVIVSAPVATGGVEGAGVVYVIAATSVAAPGARTLAAEADARVHGTVGNGGFGATVRAIGDHDGDQRDDVLIGSTLSGADGQAVLVSGAQVLSGTLLATAARHSFAPAVGDAIGASLCGGDADADGRADVVIGAPGAGGVRLWRASTIGVPGSHAAASGLWIGGGDAALADGASCAWGDLDGDGRADLIVGADPPPQGSEGGTVRVFISPY